MVSELLYDPFPLPVVDELVLFEQFALVERSQTVDTDLPSLHTRNRTTPSHNANTNILAGRIDT